MMCREVRKRLPDYTTGNLKPAEIEELETHLAACPGCNAELCRMRAVWERLGRLPEEELPDTMRARFDAILAQEIERAAGETVTRHPATGTAGSRSKSAHGGARVAPPAWWPRQLVPQLSLALLILLIGVVLGWRLRPGTERGEFALLRAEVQQLRDELTLVPVSQASAVDRLAAIHGLRQAEQLPLPVLETLVTALVSDPNVNVRLAVVDALADHLDRQMVRDAFYRSLRGQSSPIVQIEMVEVLVDLDDPQGQQVIRRLAADDQIDPAVRAHLYKRLGQSL